MTAGLQHFLDALHRRWRSQTALDWFLEASFTGAILCALCLLGHRIFGETQAAVRPIPPVLLLALVGSAVAVFPGLIATLIYLKNRRLSPFLVAEVDRRLGLEESLLTAKELLVQPSPPRLWTALTMRLGDRLARADMKSLVPTPRFGYRAGACIAVTAALLAAFLPSSLESSRRTRRMRQVTPEGAPATSSKENPASKPNGRIVANFKAFPRKGKPPLAVVFEQECEGEVADWSWDFGDIYAGQERYGIGSAPRHIYRIPGRYTVSLKVKGPAGEDVEVKREYIEVEGEQGGGGGGGGSMAVLPQPAPTQGAPPHDPPSNSAGNQTSELYGKPEEKLPIKPIPYNVKPLEQESSTLAEKEKAVYVPDFGTEGAPDDPNRFKQILQQYRRVAEEQIGRDPIPQALKDYVRAYFDRIQKTP